MSEQFYFSVLRITCVQLLRAAGIDRAAPGLVDALTDICVRHLELISKTAAELAHLSGREEAEVYDVALAMEKVGLIRPISILDPRDENPDGISGFNEFIEWAKGAAPRAARQVAQAPAGQTPLAANTRKIEATTADSKPDGPETTKEDAGILWFNAVIDKLRSERRGKLAGTIIDDDGEYNAFTGTIAGGPETIDEYMNDHKRRRTERSEIQQDETENRERESMSATQEENGGEAPMESTVVVS